MAQQPVAGPGAAKISRAQVVGLPIAATGVMFGIALAVNPDRFGVAASILGGGMIIVGLVVGRRLFRSTGPPGADQESQGDTDT